MLQSTSGTLDSIYKIRQCIAFLTAFPHKVKWYMDGQTIRGKIIRGKYSNSCVCPVTAAYHILFNLYAPPKLSNSVANVLGMTKEDAVRINIACDYESEDPFGYPLRPFIMQSLMWNHE